MATWTPRGASPRPPRRPPQRVDLGVAGAAYVVRRPLPRRAWPASGTVAGTPQRLGAHHRWPGCRWPLVAWALAGRRRAAGAFPGVRPLGPAVVHTGSRRRVGVGCRRRLCTGNPATPWAGGFRPQRGPPCSGRPRPDFVVASLLESPRCWPRARVWSPRRPWHPNTRMPPRSAPSPATPTTPTTTAIHPTRSRACGVGRRRYPDRLPARDRPQRFPPLDL